jgi:hypothetical protein
MQHCRKEAPAREPLQNRPVHIRHMLFEHVVEVPHGLVQMEAKNKADRRHG